MTYALSFDAGRDDAPPKDDPPVNRRPTIEEILRILRNGGPILGRRTIRTIRMEFDLDAEDGGGGSD